MMNYFKKITKNKPHINRDQLILGLTGCIYVLPVLYDLLRHGWERLFTFFAADTFYYLTVARNFARIGLFSFDGEFPTNGFHPLWQIISGGLYWLTDQLSKPEPASLIVIFIFSVICVLMSLIFVGKAYQRLAGHLPIWFLILPVGLYVILSAWFEPRFGTLWSFTNGMETPLVFISFGLFALILSHQNQSLSWRYFVGYGFVLSLIALSRLDHFMIAAAFLLVGGVSALAKQDGRKLSGFVLASGIVFLVLAAYLLINKLTLGIWMPVSGGLKTTFPHMSAGAEKIRELKALMPNIGTPNFGVNFWRYAQILFPIPIAFAVLIEWLIKGVKQKIDEPLQKLLGPTAIFCILLAFYNFSFVPTLDQGHWYFPISLLFMSLALVNWLARIKLSKAAFGVIMILLTLGSLGFYAQVYRSDTHNQRYIWVYQHANQIKNHFADSPEAVKFIEFDDGILTYMTGIPAMSGFGFCLDPEAAEAYKNGELINLAYQRGYRYIGSLYYFQSSGLTQNSGPEDVSAYLANRFIAEKYIDSYLFNMDYTLSTPKMPTDQKLIFIRFDKTVTE